MYYVSENFTFKDPTSKVSKYPKVNVPIEIKEATTGWIFLDA